MAWLQQEKSGIYHVCFRYGKRRYKTSTRTRQLSKAEGLQLRIEENIELVERGRLLVPEEVDLLTFLTSDGRLAQKPEAKDRMSLGQLYEAYVESLPRDSHSPESLRIAMIHMKHVARVLGLKTPLSSVTTAHLQRYVSARSKEPGKRGKRVSTGTIRKEIATFRTLWRWARGFDPCYTKSRVTRKVKEQQELRCNSSPRNCRRERTMVAFNQPTRMNCYPSRSDEQ